MKESKNPSVYTLVYWLIKFKHIQPEALFNFLELFWPTFIQKDKYIFLKENFNEEYYRRLINENSTRIEYWLNLFTVDDYFSDLPDADEKSILFSKFLVEIWQSKLEKDFPNLNFTVKFVSDEEFGDYGLTFYQEVNDPNIEYTSGK